MIFSNPDPLEVRVHLVSVPNKTLTRYQPGTCSKLQLKIDYMDLQR